MGSMPYSGGTAFRVWAPFASSAAVAGEFNHWHATSMAREPSTGNWSVDISGARPGQRYKYVFNGYIWKRDPRARKVTHSSGDSVIYDPAAFDWGSSQAPVLPPNDVVIYQLHIGTFAGKEPPAMAKGMAAMKAGMKMMLGNPDQQAADLITDGCGMGVKSLSRYLNQYPNAQPQAQKITRELIGEEESLAKAVRPYL